MQFIDWILAIPQYVIPNRDLLLEGLWTTFRITFTAIFFGMIIGTFLALMRTSNSRILRGFAKFYVNAFRSIPLLLVLFWFYLAVPELIKYLFNLSPATDIRLVSALIAFSLFEAAYYSEIIRAGINAVSKGQFSAAYALGMTKSQTMRLIVLPQALKAMLPILLTQCIILFQDTSLVYIMALTDFFGASYSRIVSTYGQSAKIPMIMFVAISYFIISFCASRLVVRLKKR